MLLMLFLESQEFHHLPFGNYFNKFYKDTVVGKKKCELFKSKDSLSTVFWVEKISECYSNGSIKRFSLCWRCWNQKIQGETRNENNKNKDKIKDKNKIGNTKKCKRNTKHLKRKEL